MKDLKILVNAYACAPNLGSEPGMAWNWCIHLAKHNELFIITEQEHQDSIEAFLSNYLDRDKLHFYYISVTPRVRRMCKNQGDWRFYFFYEKWQKEVLMLAKSIVKEHNIDILHQLNMIGFREPGYLWKIKDIPLVWGPIGGLHQFPAKYLKGSSLKMKLFFYTKIILNKIQFRFSPRVNKAIKYSNILISATPDSYNRIKKVKKRESIHIPDQATHTNKIDKIENRFIGKKLNVIWVGKFDFGKQLHIALKALAKTKNRNIILNIYGSGNEMQVYEAKKLTKELNMENQVIFHGFQAKDEINKAMQRSDIFLFTSVSEGTPTVIMEAISNNLPIICYDACGFGIVVDETIGIKLQLTNPKTSINEFAFHLNELYNDRDRLISLSKGCIEAQEKLSWTKNAKNVTMIYQSLAQNGDKE